VPDGQAAALGRLNGRVRSVVGTGATVTDIAEQRKVVGSNLTAVELSGLTKVELGFALVLSVAATGLALVVVAVGAAGWLTLRALRRPAIEELRDL
jgi:hypothetical protein